MNACLPNFKLIFRDGLVLLGALLSLTFGTCASAGVSTIGVVMKASSDRPDATFTYLRVVMLADGRPEAADEQLFAYYYPEGENQGLLQPRYGGHRNPQQVMQAFHEARSAVVSDIDAIGKLYCFRMPLPTGFAINDPATGRALDVGGGFALLTGLTRGASTERLFLQRERTGIFGRDQMGRVMFSSFLPPGGEPVIRAGDSVWVDRALWKPCAP